MPVAALPAREATGLRFLSRLPDRCRGGHAHRDAGGATRCRPPPNLPRERGEGRMPANNGRCGSLRTESGADLLRTRGRANLLRTRKRANPPQSEDAGLPPPLAGEGRGGGRHRRNAQSPGDLALRARRATRGVRVQAVSPPSQPPPVNGGKGKYPRTMGGATPREQEVVRISCVHGKGRLPRNQRTQLSLPRLRGRVGVGAGITECPSLEAWCFVSVTQRAVCVCRRFRPPPNLPP